MRFLVLLLALLTTGPKAKGRERKERERHRSKECETRGRTIQLLSLFIWVCIIVFAVFAILQKYLNERFRLLSEKFLGSNPLKLGRRPSKINKFMAMVSAQLDSQHALALPKQMHNSFTVNKSNQAEQFPLSYQVGFYLLLS